MCNYLTKRGATYYFRRVVPDDLRVALNGRLEWTYSLRTKDRKEGERKARIDAVKYDALIDEMRSALATGEAPFAPLIPLGSPALSEAEIENSEFISLEMAAEEFDYEKREADREAIIARLKLPTSVLTPADLALKDLLDGQKFETDVAHERLVMSRWKAGAEQVAAQPLRAGLANKPDQSAPEQSGIMIDALIDKWAAQAKVTAKTVDARRAVGRWLYERVGEIAIEKLTRRDVLLFKDKMLEEGATPANVKTKLSRLRALLQFAKDNDLASINAADGISISDPDARKNKRKPFALSHLKTIFSSPVFGLDERPTAGRGETAYWLPILALYTGARLEELGQLRPSDVRVETYLGEGDAETQAWLIHLVEDEAEGLKLKNAGSERTVPVHPTLVDLGFIQYVLAAKEAGDIRLFPLLKPDKYGRLTAKWGEWFSGYLRQVCGITDRRFVFHSFRHSWKHFARDVGVTEGIQRQIMGHTSGDVADEYGDGFSVFQLVEGMKLYRIRGFEPPRPPPSFRA